MLGIVLWATLCTAMGRVGRQVEVWGRAGQTASLHQQKSAEKPSACASKVSSYFKNIMLEGEKLRCAMSDALFRNCFERHDFLDQMAVIVH